VADAGRAPRLRLREIAVSLLRQSVRTLAACAALAIPAAASAQAFTGPTPYLAFAGSPFSGISFAGGYFHLENFEDGALNTPGASLLGPGSVTAAGGPFTDSVDEDDGAVDGTGHLGRSLLNSLTTSFEFQFDAVALGALPTHAGVVWTDVGAALNFGIDPVSLIVFGPGLPVGGVSFGPFQLGDGTAIGIGATAEDRFFGVNHDGGISSIRIVMTTSADWEVDHLQYGNVGAALIPEPATVALTAGGLLLLAGGGAARRRRA
jgi:hypothetical protein